MTKFPQIADFFDKCLQGVSRDTWRATQIRKYGRVNMRLESVYVGKALVISTIWKCSTLSWLRSTWDVPQAISSLFGIRIGSLDRIRQQMFPDYHETKPLLIGTFSRHIPEDGMTETGWWARNFSPDFSGWRCYTKQSENNSQQKVAHLENDNQFW